MNVFVIHSGSDREIITHKVVPAIKNSEPRAKILLLGNNGRFWKGEAGKLIKEAQMILFVIGPKSHESSNIAWEIKKAIASNKMLVCLKLDEDCILHEELFGTDRFTKQKKLLAYEAKSTEDIAARIRKYEDGDYDLFNDTIENLDRAELIEQYKAFLETSERLVERRQTVNNFYLSTNTALFTIVAAVLSFLEGTTEKLIISIVLAFIGIILSMSWRNLLDAYGVLNSSKMKVISIIERKLPLSLYDTEWIIMSDKLNSKKYVSFTDGEKKIPNVFMLLYIAECVISILLILFQQLI